VTTPGGPSSADKKRADAALKASREAVRYRVDFTELPEGQEPNWDALIQPTIVERFVYGAGWLEVLPIRPVMADEMRDRTMPPTDSRIHLTGPIWPPRGS
jgi:hypothetical protein